MTTIVKGEHDSFYDDDILSGSSSVSFHDSDLFAEVIDPATRQPLEDVSYNQQNVDVFISNELQKLVQAIHTRRKVKLTNILRITPAVKKYGVRSSQLNTLLDLIFSQVFSTLQVLRIIPLLLPRNKVSQSQIMRIYGNLSCREYDPVIMERLLEWVICIYDDIDGKKELMKLYGVLFHHLTLESLRPYLCHLLFLMTKKIHVKPYRVRFLLDLAKKNGTTPQLNALIKIFLSYNPTVEGAETFENFRLSDPYITPNKELLQNLKAIRNFWSFGDTSSVQSLDESTTSEAVSTDVTDMAKRRKRQTGHSQRKRHGYASTKVLKEEVHGRFDPDVLLGFLDTQTVPEQILTVLDNRMVQHILICNPNDTIIPRVCNVLAQQLMEIVYWEQQTDESNAKLKDLLDKILDLSRFAKANIPVMENFLSHYLKSWNGIDMQYEIFELITFVKPKEFDVIFSTYLKPLCRLFYVSNVQWKAKLILCYKNWLKNWALLDWRHHTEKRNQMSEDELETEVDSLAWLFQGLSFKVDYIGTMQEMIYHVDRLCVQGLVLEQDHPLLQHAALSFFEFTSTLLRQHDIPIIIIPKASLVYRCFFTSNAMTVSRLCGLLYEHKLSFEENDKKTDDWMVKDTEESLDSYNAYILDICNGLWKNMAFNIQSGEVSAFSLPNEIIDVFRKTCQRTKDPLHLMFSLTHSSAFVGFSKHFMKTKEEEFGIQNPNEDPVTTETVTALIDADGIPMTYMSYRMEYLDYLKELGFDGVYDLLYACMSSLMNYRASSPAED